MEFYKEFVQGNNTTYFSKSDYDDLVCSLEAEAINTATTETTRYVRDEIKAKENQELMK